MLKRSDSLVVQLVVYKNIVYCSPTGPFVSSVLPAYIVIDFPKYFIRDYHKVLSDKPRT